MSQNEVQSHFTGKATEDIATIVGTLLDVIKNNPNIKLTPDQSNIFSAKKDEVKLSSKSVVDIYRSRLKELWKDYVEPLERKADVEAAYNRWVKSQRKSFKASVKTRSKEANDKRKEIAEASEEEFVDNLFEPVKEEGDICYGLNLKTLTIDYSRPLRYTGKIELKLLDDCVMISPLTKIVDISKTLKKILLKGAEYGWTRDNIGTLLKLFVKEHLRVSYTCLAYLEDSTEIWEAVSNLIDFSSAEATILQSMKGLIRKKNHGIGTVVNAYKSLAFDLHEIKSPYASKVECLTQADKDAVKICRHFIEPNLCNLLKGITDKIRYEEKRKVQLDEMIDLINRYEMGSEYRPKSDKSLDKFDVSQVSIFMCETGARSNDHESIFAQDEVYTVGQDNTYESIGGASLSTLRKEGDQYRSTSSLGSSTWGTTKTQGDNDRGRKPKRGSPFTGRKRLYINKNGERKSVSRNRLETWDEDNKKFVPRPLSKSGDRRHKSSGNCLLCNSPHPGTCHWYGKIKPTKEQCPTCGGHHNKAICLGKRSVTPGGSRRSPSAAGRSASRDSSKERGEKEKKKDWFPSFKSGNA